MKQLLNLIQRLPYIGKNPSRVFLLLTRLFLLISFFVSVFMATRLETHYSLRQFFPEKHPLIVRQKSLEKSFSEQDQPPFLVQVNLTDTEDNFLNQTHLDNLDKLTKKFEQLESVDKVHAITNIDIPIVSDTDLVLGPFYKAYPKEMWQEALKQNSLLRPRLISQDYKEALVAIETVPDATGEKIKLALAEIQNVLDEESQPIYNYTLSGIPSLQIEVSDKIGQEVATTFVISLIAFCILTLILFKGIQPLIICLLGLTYINFMGLGLLGLFNVPLNALLVTMPILISIAFISLYIHTLFTWSNCQNIPAKNSAGRLQKSWDCLKDILPGNFLSLFTTCLGFFALAPSNIPAIKQYGIAVSSALFVIFVLSHVFFILVLNRTTVSPRTWIQSSIKIFDVSMKYPRTIIVACLLFAVFSLSQFSNLNFSSKLYTDLKQSDPARLAMEHISDSFGGSLPLNLSIESKEQDAWTLPENLSSLKSAIIEINNLSGVKSALSIGDFFNKVPATKALVSENLFLFSMSSEDPTRKYIDADRRTARVLVKTNDIESTKMNSVVQGVKESLKKHLPQFDIKETGLATSSHTINYEVTTALIFGFWQALAIIFIFLMFFFRSFRWALVSVIPNLAAPTALITYLATTNTPVKPSLAIIFSIALGITFNNTVYIIKALIKAQKKIKNKSDLHLHIRQEYLPCVSESIVTFVGFALFLFSSFELSYAFGVCMLNVVIAAAIGDLFLLPAIILNFPSFFFKNYNSKLSRESDHMEDQVGVKKYAYISKVGALMAFLLVSVSSIDKVYAAELTAKDVLNQSRKLLEANSNEFSMDLLTLETNGDKKERSIVLKSIKDGDTVKSLIRVTSPAEAKDTAFLIESKESGESSQWMYMPASKKVRRVTTESANSNGILGSELSADDLDWGVLSESNAKIIENTNEHYVLEITPSEGEQKLIKLKLKKEPLLPDEMAYFKNNKLTKRLKIKTYKKINQIYRPTEIYVSNLDNGRKTTAKIQNIVPKPSLSNSLFTLGSFRRNLR